MTNKINANNKITFGINSTFKILHADDDTTFLELTKRFLEKKLLSSKIPCEIITVSDSTKVLDLLEETNANLIISDYQMPNLNGLELLEQLRLSTHKEIPFIMLTGKGREEIAIEALNLGANYYINKTSDVNSQFQELVHNIDLIQEKYLLHLQVFLTEKRYETLYHEIPYGIITGDLEGNIVDANDTAQLLLGSPSEKELLEINLLSFPPLVEIGASKIINDCMASKSIMYSVMPFTSAWGKTGVYRSKYVPLIENDDVKGVLITFEDISKTEKFVDAIKALQINLINQITSIIQNPSHSLENIIEAIADYVEADFFNLMIVDKQNDPKIVQSVIKIPENNNAMSFLKRLFSNHFPVYQQMIEDKNPIIIKNINQIPTNALKVRQFFIEKGFQNHILYTLTNNDDYQIIIFLGNFSIELVGWSDFLISWFNLIGEIIPKYHFRDKKYHLFKIK